MTLRQKITFVCDRLEIPTLAMVGNYQTHMILAHQSILEEEELRGLVDVDTLSWINDGIRHCDFFDVLFESISKGMAVSQAAASVLEAWEMDEEGEEPSTERICFEHIVG